MVSESGYTVKFILMDIFCERRIFFLKNDINHMLCGSRESVASMIWLIVCWP